MVKITIVTPTRNARKFLRNCLESVAAQTKNNVEIEHMILDGGSTDDTVEIAKEYGVRFVERPQNMGLVDAMCLGYENATGDLIGFLGADDVLLPNALKHVAKVYNSEQREVIFCRARWVDSDLKSLGELAPLPRWCTSHAHASLGWCYVSACASYITPRLYRELGGFDRNFTISEDYEFFTRILHRGIPFSRVNAPVGMYRRHNDNESMRKDDLYWGDLQRVQSAYAPKNRNVRKLWSVAFRSWIYGRNWNWALHQFYRKLHSRSLHT